MFIFVFLILVVLVLFIANRIYIIKNKRSENERLKNVQRHLFGYEGMASKEKREDLYKKYLDVNNRLV